MANNETTRVRAHVARVLEASVLAAGAGVVAAGAGAGEVAAAHASTPLAPQQPTRATPAIAERTSADFPEQEYAALKT
jgi:hypothetical protein